MKEYLSVGETAKELGVCIKTIHRWEVLGKLKSHYRTIGNHRRFLKYDILKLKHKNNRINIGYARVSSYDQKKDLNTQIDFLNNHAKLNHIKNFHIIKDLGSGLNFKKKGLKQLIALILSSQIDTLYLTHKDRLLRFGSELIVAIAHQFNTKLSLFIMSPIPLRQH